MFQNMSSDYAETHMKLSLLANDYGISEHAKRLIGNQLALLFYMFLALLINAINNILIGELDGVEAFLLHYGDERLCGIAATVLIPARLQYSMLWRIMVEILEKLWLMKYFQIDILIVSSD
ncbi:hypothetical protein Tco_0294320 [Tanacetum coccineum]